MAPMSVMINENRSAKPRPGLASGFADGPPGDRKDLWRRVLFTLGALFVYRIGAQLPLPGFDMLVVREFFAARSSGIIGLFEMYAGIAAIERVSIFALGIMPCVSAFIIVQLASRIISPLGKLAVGGPAQRARLNQYGRILTLVLAALQAVGVAFAFKRVPGLVGMPSPLFEVTTIITVVAGALYLMWLAEQISARGLGDGTLVILAFGVAGDLPNILGMHLEAHLAGELEGLWLLASPAMTAAFLVLVVFVECAERRRPIRHGDVSRRINPAGVMPALAAGIFVGPLWQTIARVGGGEATQAGYFTGVGYLLLYATLIVVLAVFFNFAALMPDEATKEVGESGSVSPGGGSGETAARLASVLPIVLAAAYAAGVCVLPLLFYRWRNFSFVLSGFNIFLLGWLTTRILERGRASWQS